MSQELKDEGTACLSRLLAAHGELITGDDLRRVLGYGSERSFSRAIKEGSVPIPLVRIPGRRGRFARTHDVAKWLAGLGP